MSLKPTATAAQPFDPDRTPVARDVMTHCNKEKHDTWHVVLNHDMKGFVDRVQCKACKSIHKYKRQAVAKVVKTVVRRPAESSGASAKAAAQRVAQADPAAFQDQWLAGIKAWGDKPVRSYDPSLHLVMGEVVQHGAFGKGYVKARRDNKVDVVFQNGLKTLPSPKA